MDDILSSLYVLLGVGLLVAVIFLLSRRKARQKEEELAAYCAQNGYQLTVQHEPLMRSIRIETDAWQLTSIMRSIRNEGDTGSSGWHRETEWVCLRENPLRQTFAMQVSQGSTNLDQLPQWLKDAAISALKHWLGDDMQALDSVRTLSFDKKRTCLVFEPEPGAADATLEQLRVLLEQYTGTQPLYLECSPSRGRLFLPDVKADSVPVLERLISIGKVLQ
ncbi:MAG: hypothetical protein R2912_08300 [Eubacteriales bacterium]